MKNIAFLIVLPVLLSACAANSQYLPTEELRALKPACASGDVSACSDIGHKVRRDQAESAYLAKTQ